MKLQDALHTGGYLDLIDNRQFKEAFGILDTREDRAALFSLLEQEGENPLANFEEIPSGIFNRLNTITKLDIPDTVKIIDHHAFYGCERLTTVVMSPNVTEIRYRAYQDCEHLRGIIFSSNLKHIGEAAFHSCDQLTQLVIPNSVEVIEEMAFERCSNLHTILLGSELKEFGRATFSLCDNLQQVTMCKGSYEFPAYLFRWCKNLKQITFNGTKEDWKAIPKDSYWNYKTPDIIINCDDGILHEKYEE